MSDSGIDEILKQVVLTLEKDIRDELNTETTIATFTSSIIERALIAQLDFIYAPKKGKKVRAQKYPAWHALNEQERKDITKLIKEEAESLNEKLYKEYKKYKPQGLIVAVKKVDKNSFKVTITAIEGGTLGTKTGRGGRTYEINSFAAMRQGYSESVRVVWNKIALAILKKEQLDEKNDKQWLQGPADLEHRIGESVAEKRVGRALDELAGKLSKSSTFESKERVLKALGLKAYIKYAALSSATYVNVYLGPASENRSRGSIAEKNLIEKLKTIIQDSLKSKILKSKNKIFTDWKGSDSRYTIEKKKIVESFISAVKANKKVKAKSIDTKLNLSNKTSKQKTIKGKKNSTKTAKVTFNAKVEKININSVQKATQPVLNLNALKAQINARLSMTVIKNMGTPALENRTGRFARSAIVTDVTQTNKGYPSIGYDYQKFPYQTFEPGFKQGSAQRDPRTLIDRSIREIASQLIVGRFYTRRT